MFVDRLQALADEQIAEKVKDVPPDVWVQIEKSILLQSLDHHWKEHLSMLDALRQVVHLRAYAQKKPIDEYKHEAFSMFERMLAVIREDVTGTLGRAQFSMQPEDYSGHAGVRDAPYRSVQRRRRHVRHRRGDGRDRLEAAAAADPAAGDAGAWPARWRRRRAATRPVPAARAASTSIATAWRSERA